MNKINAPLLQEPEENKASIASCSLLLANGAIGTDFPLESPVGAGILTLSMAVGKIGWGFGLAMYVFFSCTFFFPFETRSFRRPDR